MLKGLHKVHMEDINKVDIENLLDGNTQNIVSPKVDYTIRHEAKMVDSDLCKSHDSLDLIGLYTQENKKDDPALRCLNFSFQCIIMTEAQILAVKENDRRMKFRTWITQVEFVGPLKT